MDWQNMFAIRTFPYIRVPFYIFYYYCGEEYRSLYIEGLNGEGGGGGAHAGSQLKCYYFFGCQIYISPFVARRV